MNKYVADKKVCKVCKKEFKPESNGQKFCNKCKTKKCKYCGKEFRIDKWGFKKRNEALFCSRECYYNSRWKINNKCKNCGKQVKNGRYCSKQCQKDFWNKNDYHIRRKKKYWEDKIVLIKELGGKCEWCGQKDVRVLDINHKDRNKKKRPKNLSYTWQRRLKEWKENKNNLQILCANCHRILTWKQMGYANNGDYVKITS